MPLSLFHVDCRCLQANMRTFFHAKKRIIVNSTLTVDRTQLTTNETAIAS